MKVETGDGVDDSPLADVNGCGHRIQSARQPGPCGFCHEDTDNGKLCVVDQSLDDDPTFGDEESCGLERGGTADIAERRKPRIRRLLDTNEHSSVLFEQPVSRPWSPIFGCGACRA